MTADILSVNVFHFLLAFARIGTVFMVIPVFASGFVPARMRLALALAVAFAFLPNISGAFPAPPADLGTLTVMLLSETAVGLFLGLIPAFAMVAAEFAGYTVATAAGFANAQTLDPNMGSQSLVMTVFMTFAATMIIVTADLHHLMIAAAADSYGLFAPGGAPMIGDMAQSLIDGLNRAFLIGFKMGAPFIVLSILMHVLSGVVSRLMPQLQIMFLIMPLQAYLGISLLLITAGAIMMWFAEYFEDTIGSYG